MGIYCTLGNFSKPVASFILTKSPTFLGKIFHFSSGIILGNFYRHLVTFYWSHCIETMKVRERERENRKANLMRTMINWYDLRDSVKILSAKKQTTTHR